MGAVVATIAAAPDAESPDAQSKGPAASSLFASMEIGSDSCAAASGRRETSDATSSSTKAPAGPDPFADTPWPQRPATSAKLPSGPDPFADPAWLRRSTASEHNQDQIIKVVLPFCGDASLKHLSRRATGILRHSDEAKKATDGVMPIDTFCQKFDKRRSLGECLASIVRGSDKARFEIGMQTPGGAVPAFLTNAKKLSFDEASRSFQQCAEDIRSICAIQGHTFKTNV